MQRVVTTVVAVVGGSSGLLDRMGEAANVRSFHGGPEAPPLERAAEAWSAARRVRSPYFVHDADPLGWVVDTWAAHFDGEGAAGELEVAVSQTVRRWRAGSVELPDYYLVVAPDEWGQTRRHWYLGVLASAAPSRVVVDDGRGDATSILPGLATGPWWPNLDMMLEGLDRVVPDRAGLEGGKKGPDEPALIVGTDR